MTKKNIESKFAEELLERISERPRNWGNPIPNPNYTPVDKLKEIKFDTKEYLRGLPELSLEESTKIYYGLQALQMHYQIGLKIDIMKDY